jgi:hypothetical protein
VKKEESQVKSACVDHGKIVAIKVSSLFTYKTELTTKQEINRLEIQDRFLAIKRERERERKEGSFYADGNRKQNLRLAHQGNVKQSLVDGNKISC